MLMSDVYVPFEFQVKLAIVEGNGPHHEVANCRYQFCNDLELGARETVVIDDVERERLGRKSRLQNIQTDSIKKRN